MLDKVTNVLVALDLVARSSAVLARAAQLAVIHAARLVVLHVIEAELLVPTAAHMNLTRDELRAKLEQQAIAELHAQLVAVDQRLESEVRVAFGAPHEVITQTALSQDADVIVLGANSSTSLKDKILGSTADRVIRSSATPVIVVREFATEPYRRVAVAIHDSQASVRAITETRRLVPNAAMQLVHAVDIPITFRQMLLRAGTSRIEVDQYRAARAGKAREELAAFLRDVPKMQELPVRIVDGEPGPALIRFSARARLDLLVLGSRRRGPASNILLGSVARYVLAESSTDVLVIADL